MQRRPNADTTFTTRCKRGRRSRGADDTAIRASRPGRRRQIAGHAGTRGRSRPMPRQVTDTSRWRGPSHSTNSSRCQRPRRRSAAGHREALGRAQQRRTAVRGPVGALAGLEGAAPGKIVVRVPELRRGQPLEQGGQIAGEQRLVLVQQQPGRRVTGLDERHAVPPAALRDHRRDERRDVDDLQRAGGLDADDRVMDDDAEIGFSGVHHRPPRRPCQRAAAPGRRTPRPTTPGRSSASSRTGSGQRRSSPSGRSGPRRRRRS